MRFRLVMQGVHLYAIRRPRVLQFARSAGMTDAIAPREISGWYAR
jgi:hypothetical protein